MHPEIARIQSMLEGQGYVADQALATSVYLAIQLRKPLLIEGAAGVGKTEVAKVMARALETDLIRLQCYEGLDATTSLYEWNYQRQLLHIRMLEQSDKPLEAKEREIFSEPFLLKRPLLQAITHPKSPVLLIDEIDRCITPESLIVTAEGVKPASEICPGETLISFDPDTFSLGRSLVKKIVPRRATSLVTVFVGGRFLQVTPEHKFVRFTESGYETVRASALRLGDRIPLSKMVPEAVPEEPAFTIDDEIELHRLCEVLGLDNLNANPELARGLRVNSTVAFYELLGYIVGDGCFTSDRLCIVDKDRRNLDVYAEKFEEAFGLAPRIVRGPHRNNELTFWSLPFGRFLRRVLGEAIARSRKRTLPGFVYRLPMPKRAAFVRGYFDAEGWVGDHQVCATSASPYLLAGIQQLLISLGIDSHIMFVRPVEGSFSTNPYYTLAISDTEAFRRLVGFCAPARAEKLSRIASASAFARTETLPTPMVIGALNQLRLSRVLHRTPSHQTVHDILAGRVKPNASALRKIAHAFDDRWLDGLLQSQVVLGEVTRIQSTSADSIVYDFVLDGEPYFVANQIVTHNCDEEFEAFLLEVLSDWQITIPEIGTIRAQHIPYVVLTSNRTRELGDALRRRCLYLWIDYPALEKELAIVRRKIPGINADLAEQIATFMQLIRRTKLEKAPGIAETLDWSAALIALHRDHLDAEAVEQTIGVLFKHRDDADRVRSQWLDHLLRGVEEAAHEGHPLTQAAVDRVAERVLPRR
jgi:MoxR-like ATPase/intein/homing endonuclease